MAIDDVSNVEGECPDTEMCTFEIDFCSWVNGENGVVDDFDWLRKELERDSKVSSLSHMRINL